MKAKIKFPEQKKEIVTEIGAVLDFDLEPSELILMEERGLHFIEKNGQKIYNALEFQGHYDQLFAALNGKVII